MNDHQDGASNPPQTVQLTVTARGRYLPLSSVFSDDLRFHHSPQVRLCKEHLFTTPGQSHQPGLFLLVYDVCLRAYIDLCDCLNGM
jgi:hypothetical protein